MFRALGGERGLRIEAARETAHRAQRRWLQRLAGSGNQIELAWREEETLRLPARIAWFAERDLNRDLYLWLAALAADSGRRAGDWLQQNSAATAALLAAYPGLAGRYRRLVAAHLPQRPQPDALRRDAAAQE